MKKRKINIAGILGVLFIVGLLVLMVSAVSSIKSDTVPVEEITADMSNVEEILKDGNTYTVKYADNSIKKTADADNYLQEVAFQKGIEVSAVKETPSIFNALSVSLLVILAILLIIVVSVVSSLSKVAKIASGSIEGGIDVKGGKNPMGARFSTEIPKVTFKDIQGHKELKQDAMDIIKYLKNPYKYELAGARLQKGTLLYGPAGTGKTLLAKAIAGEAGVPFLSTSGADFMEMYVGVGAKRVRELFAEARKQAPCIVFIDEIDAIGGKRGQSQSGERDQTINALLTEMDGFGSGKGILVIAATNRLDILDPAITRSGRFDNHLAVNLPDKEDRLNILKLYAKNKRLDETVDLKVLAHQTTGFSGADLENLLNQAALLSVHNDKKYISNEEIDRAFFKIVMEGDVKRGQEKRKTKELELVAWHEAGHTIITKLLTRDEVTKVTILASTSGAGGVTFHNPPENEFFSKTDLKNRIAICYGGRAAEEILFGTHDEVTVGASSDIQSASKQIRDYIMKYGMSSKFGMLDIGVFENQSLSNEDVISEASTLANEIYEMTLNTLKAHAPELKAVAESLLENETLLDADINKLMGIEEKVEEEDVKVSALTAEIA